MFDILEADIVIMQETKIQRKDLRDDMILIPGWDVFFSLPKHKKGEMALSIACSTIGSPMARLFGSCNLHSKCHMRPNTCRGRHHGYLMCTQNGNKLSGSPEGAADWWLPTSRTGLWNT